MTNKFIHDVILKSQLKAISSGWTANTKTLFMNEVNDKYKVSNREQKKPRRCFFLSKFIFFPDEFIIQLRHGRSDFVRVDFWDGIFILLFHWSYCALLSHQTHLYGKCSSLSLSGGRYDRGWFLWESSSHPSTLLLFIFIS